MKKVIDILRWICAIVLAIGIIIFGFVSILSSTFLSKKYIIKKLSETDYFTNTYSQANIDFQNYVYQSGLNEKIVENLITIDDVKEDTEIIFGNIYDGKRETIDLEKVKEKLRANIERNIEENNIWVKSQESIDKYVEVVSSQYKDSILHTSMEENLFNGLENLRKLATMLTRASIIMIGIPLIFILVSRYKKFWQNFTMIGIPLVTAGAFYVFTNVFINTSADIDHIIIFSEAISYTIRTVLFDILNKVCICGVIMLIFGTVLIFAGNIIRSMKHSHSHSRHR